MKALVIYDSTYGNTEKVAQAIGQALGAPPDVQVMRVSDASPSSLAGLDLLVVGSPTVQFNPLKPVTAFLNAIPGGGLKGIAVAAFDTRMTQEAVDKIRILGFFVRIFGYAAKDIDAAMTKKGGKSIASPAGFYVADTEGPLLDGELQRAADWAAKIASATGR